MIAELVLLLQDVENGLEKVKETSAEVIAEKIAELVIESRKNEYDKFFYQTEMHALSRHEKDYIKDQKNSGEPRLSDKKAKQITVAILTPILQKNGRSIRSDTYRSNYSSNSIIGNYYLS